MKSNRSTGLATAALMLVALAPATSAAPRPNLIVILVDDLHFAPEEGRALFASLAHAVPGHRVLLVGTTRPGLPEKWTAGLTRLEHASQMALSRLGPKDLVRLLREALRFSPPDMPPKCWVARRHTARCVMLPAAATTMFDGV